ncbi:MAG: DUF3124 domain-containing protein [Xenococcaceae cyanobacterium]
MRSSICLVIAILGLTGCQSLNGQNTGEQSPSTPTDSCAQYSPNTEKGGTSVSSETLNPSKIVRGQKIYIPFYSQEYQPQGISYLNFRGILSIRNTSETDPIRITRVHYFNTDGKLVKKCLDGKHLVVSPMATKVFGITQRNETGGSGANFIMEWVSEKAVSDPVVDSIMVITSGTQGYTLRTSGQVIEEFK